MSDQRTDRGFVAIEWVAAIAVLLLPVVVVVATLPTWVERRHAAMVAAREAARLLADDWPHGDPGAATALAREIAADHGIAPADVVVRIRAVGTTRGDQARVDVEVAMPAIAIAGIRVGAFTTTAVGVRRIDDYRSR